MKHPTTQFHLWLEYPQKDEIYTVHTTTPNQHSFFTDGHVFMGISVTGDALKDLLIRVSIYSIKLYTSNLFLSVINEL
jgi:hypothetical protein